MIVPMKRIVWLTRVDDVTTSLENLRQAGCVHLDCTAADSAGVTQARAAIADAEKATRCVLKARAEMRKEGAATTSRDKTDDLRAPQTVADILATEAARIAAADKIHELKKTIRKYAAFGDFDPVLARKVCDKAGLELVLTEEGTWLLDATDKIPEDLRTVPLPPMRLSALEAACQEAAAACQAATAKLCAVNVATIAAEYPALKDRLAFVVAEAEFAAAGAVKYVTGWIPVDAVDAVRQLAATTGCGVMVRDPEADETPPTLVRPPKMFRAVKALFEGLGIAPAYHESDVSVPFMCYFSLFFAMLVGDGAYGTIFLLATLWGWKKTAGKRVPAVTNALVLMTVFSLATIGWGFLSNTWFGTGFPFARHWPTVQWLADPSYNNMMLLCFTIGVSHLMLARIWSGICLLGDRTAFAQFGWAGILLFMYLVTNAIVGVFSGVPTWGFWMFGISLAIVFLFTLKPCELKSRGIELGMLPLNIMSALGDIISYVRLFAVGLASVQVAANFNDMAVGLFTNADSIWLKIPMALAMVAILLVGHGLNLAMAGLSILVHAVRLNTLEFSNHKGVSWAGYAFQPFKRVRCSA